MRYLIIISTVISSLFLLSCNQNKKNTNQVNPQIESTTDQIVKSSVTNDEGIKLDMIFNNTKRTATFLLKDETIELKQDTMASGIKYSNDQYIFTEWHGEISLKKDGEEIFADKK